MSIDIKEPDSQKFKQARTYLHTQALPYCTHLDSSWPVGVFTVSLTSRRAVCSFACHLVASSQVQSQWPLISSVLLANFSTLLRFLECSARWLLMTLIDIMRDLWLSSSMRNSLWSWMASSSCSMLTGTLRLELRVARAWSSQVSMRHMSCSNWRQLRLKRKLNSLINANSCKRSLVILACLLPQ